MTNKQALDALLPCFGCKSVNISLTHIHDVRWGVQCHDCDLHTDPDTKTENEAISHWNKYFRWFLVDIPERCMMQDRTEEYDDGYLNGFDDGKKYALTQPNHAVNKMMMDALRDCRVAVKTGCTEHALAFVEKAIAAASSAPVVEVVDVDELLNDFFTNPDLPCIDYSTQKVIEYIFDNYTVTKKAARLQLERQKGGV